MLEFENFKKNEYRKLVNKVRKIQLELNKCRDNKPKLVERYKRKIRDLIAKYEAQLRKLKRELEAAIRECRETLKKQKKEVNSVFGIKKNKMKSHVSASKQIKF